MTAQAESIKRSIDNISAKDTYIQDLRAAVMHRDSVNLAALMELKATMGGYNDADVHIHIDEGVLYVDLSDSLLFGGDSTGYMIAAKAKPVLSRLARVLDDQSEVQFSVEGNTDSLSDAQDSLMNSWDLSVKRAVAVVRVLQNDYHILPTRMTACGRGEYMANRRTRVIIQPALDRLLRVLEHKGGQEPAQAAPASAPAGTGF
jgi:chemotaxis protein MotB